MYTIYHVHCTFEFSERCTGSFSVKTSHGLYVICRSCWCVQFCFSFVRRAVSPSVCLSVNDRVEICKIVQRYANVYNKYVQKWAINCTTNILQNYIKVCQQLHHKQLQICTKVSLKINYKTIQKCAINCMQRVHHGRSGGAKTASIDRCSESVKSCKSFQFSLPKK